ncbi:MAG: RidA family protein [Chloroflexota bacterium]
MVYVSSVGPLDIETGRIAGESMRVQARAAMENLRRRLREAGTSLDKVVWFNWALRDAGDFDAFNEELAEWFPGEAPVGQGTILPPLQRRAGFRITLGAIAEGAPATIFDEGAGHGPVVMIAGPAGISAEPARGAEGVTPAPAPVVPEDDVSGHAVAPPARSTRSTRSARSTPSAPSARSTPSAPSAPSAPASRPARRPRGGTTPAADPDAKG